MDKIARCNCGNSHKGDSAKRCSQCGTITCVKCSFTGCTCGSKSYDRQYKIG